MNTRDDARGRQGCTRTARGVRATLAVLLAAITLASLLAPTGEATASPSSTCADVHLLFARGTNEPGAPLGLTGHALYRSLQVQFPAQQVRVTPVRYAASGDFQKGVTFLKTVAAGVRTTQRQVLAVARRCPSTRIVLGGYSQGAVVVTYAVSDQLAQASTALREVPDKLPRWVSSHVASIVTFGQPSDRWFRDARIPPMRVGHQYRARSRSYCVPGDAICDGSPFAPPNALHTLYAVNGMTTIAATFAAAHT